MCIRDSLTLCGTPIVVLSAYASTSPSTMRISGAYVYPLPVFSTVIDVTFPSLTKTLNFASAPSDLVTTILGFT